jgi:hypothetical protein
MFPAVPALGVAGGVDEDDEVEITLACMRPHRVPTLPPDPVTALVAHRTGLLAFESWASSDSPFHQEPCRS